MGGRQRYLDSRAQEAIDHLRAFEGFWRGSILINNLPAVLPKRRRRSTYGDGVTVLLLTRLIGVHRLKKDENPFWSNHLYEVYRDDLAKEFGCKPDDISSSLTWLERLGFVGRVHKTRIDGVGKPCGTMVFAYPRMDRIKQALDFFTTKGRAMTASELMDSDPLQGGSNSPSEGSEVPLNDASAPLEGSAYLNCAQSQQKPADSGGAASTQRPERAVMDDRGRQAAAGGGKAADKKAPTRPPTNTAAATPPASPSPKTGANALRADAEGAGASALKRNGSLSATQPGGAVHGTQPPGQSSTTTPSRWTVPTPPTGVSLETDEDHQCWKRAASFGALWAEAIQREDLVSPCKPTSADLRAAFRYFKSYPQARAAFTAATAWNAWRVNEIEARPTGYDKVYACRQALDMQAFLRSMEGGKIMSEIRGLGWEINAWKDLRHVFTASELTFYGFKTPIAPQDPDVLWENNEEAPGYYRDRRLALPPEVAAAEECRLALQPKEDNKQPAPGSSAVNCSNASTPEASWKPGNEIPRRSPKRDISEVAAADGATIAPCEPVADQSCIRSPSGTAAQALSTQQQRLNAQPSIRRKPVPADESPPSNPSAAQDVEQEAPPTAKPPNGSLRDRLLKRRNPGMFDASPADEPSMSIDEVCEILAKITRGEDPRDKTGPPKPAESPARKTQEP